MDQTKTAIVCTNCGGKLELDESASTVICPYCGTRFSISDLLKESDAVRLEKLKQKNEREQEQKQEEKAKEQEAKDKVQRFQKSALGKWCIILAVLFAIGAVASFCTGHILSGIVAIVQVILFTGAYLMGAGHLSEPFRSARVFSTIVAFVLIIPFGFGLAMGTQDNSIEKYVWESFALHDMLPKPPSATGKNIHDESNHLSICVCKISKEAYNKYVSECETTFGYTIDKKKESTHFEATNKNGYKIVLSYSEKNRELDIQLSSKEYAQQEEEKKKGDPYVWESFVLHDKLPKPASNRGKNIFESSDHLYIDVGGCSKEDYNNYVAQCVSEYGYTVDLDKSDTIFRAKNSEGYEVSVMYWSWNAMSITLDAPKEAQPSAAPDAAPKSTPEPTKEPEKSSSAAGLGKEFKQAMDSYEKFMDEYVAIVKKYKANPTDTSILADYTKYMSKYAEMVKDFEKWESNGLNDAEAAYYLEVQSRVLKKLADVTV